MAKRTGVDAKVDRGWTRLDLLAGQGVDVPYDREENALKVARGQVFDASGKRFKGKDRPKFSIVETDDGASIKSTASCTILFRLVEAVEEDDDEGDVEALEEESPDTPTQLPA